MITAKQMHELAKQCPHVGYGLSVALKEIEFQAKLGRFHMELSFYLHPEDAAELKESGFYVVEKLFTTYISWGKECCKMQQL